MRKGGRGRKVTNYLREANIGLGGTRGKEESKREGEKERPFAHCGGRKKRKKGSAESVHELYVPRNGSENRGIREEHSLRGGKDGRNRKVATNRGSGGLFRQCSRRKISAELFQQGQGNQKGVQGSESGSVAGGGHKIV